MASKRRSKKSKKHGLAVAALAAATAAGAYFLYGSKHAARNRKRVRGWMLKARGEVLEKMEQARELQESDYKKIVDTVTGKYKELKSTNVKEVEALAKELKAEWKEISKKAAQRAKVSGSSAKKRSGKKRTGRTRRA